MSVQSLSTEFQTASAASEVNGEFCDYRGGRYYRIDQYHKMPNFFMSVVSSSDHWLFISSNGGLTAGRQNSERAFFPYYTEDKLSDMAHCTGPITLIREGHTTWQPFTSANLLNEPESRQVYKSTLGDQLFFSESHQGLSFDYGWSFSDQYGIVRTATLKNNSQCARTLSFLDGLQNIIPSNVTTDLQANNSVLLDAYKASECYDQNVAAYSLSSRLTDLAEPSESLTANTVWHRVKGGAFKPRVSIDCDAPKQFVANASINDTVRQRGHRGGYFIQADITLQPGEEVEWYFLCEVTQNARAIQNLRTLINSDRAELLIQEDLLKGSQTLQAHLAKVDGLQSSQDELTTVHHQANALFNMMRGGFFEDGYSIEREDLQKFVSVRQPALMNLAWWKLLPTSLSMVDLETQLASCESIDLKRLVREYMPISFSRRHGDPSRPWNKFSINLKDSSGQSIKDYQGNWRDIFQNWEPLAYSYPKFLPSMISAFLNATTADGYNPYRVTRQGIEWEEPEEGNAWANIGYWSDHQIIYLSKLLELQAEMDPTWFDAALIEPRFSYANVPYRIKGFGALSKDPYDSIDFDTELNREIEQRVSTMGTDGKLLLNQDGAVVHTNLIEKLLTLWLAKLSNFVPDGGLWMNTQRPEWNDANNALAGWGLSVVTMAYMHRHLKFMNTLLQKHNGDIEVSQSVSQWLNQTQRVFSTIDSVDLFGRYQTVESLVKAADEYRASLYNQGLSEQRETIPVKTLTEFLAQVIQVIESTLQANKREDGLYHGYNVLHLDAHQATIEHLPLMLEGQVAMLSADLLSPEDAAGLLSALRASDLYRDDQHTYLLYPNKQLPAFVEKNQVAAQWLQSLGTIKSTLLAKRVLTQSASGHFNFDESLRNAKDLSAVLATLNATSEEREQVLQIWEKTFQHKSFTGRSGSFFAYEGLGSTYWHMVSKLLLAAQENWQHAVQANSESAGQLADAYYDIRAGIGFNKTPDVYGAFPTDPYSHTPETGIARQPGMTGQVKEELITRLGELGVAWKNGQLHVQPLLLKTQEFLVEASHYSYLDVDHQWQSLALPNKALAFTVAQVPFVYHLTDDAEQTVIVTWADGSESSFQETVLSDEVAQSLVQRNGQIKRVDVRVKIDN